MIEEVTSGIAHLLDVRTPEEWEAGHAEHALHIPVDKLVNGEVGQLSPGKKIYIYCRSGARAGTAVAYLRSCGFQAENVGGLVDWVRAGGSLAGA